MRIAFLCKRRYMNKDVILDRYARLYEIPRQLALRGHEVLGLCLSYYPASAIDRTDDHADGRLRWLAPATGSLRLPDSAAFPFRALARLREFRPDVLIGASDAPHIVLTRWLAGRLKLPYAADLYDNFESFSLTRIPGMRRAYRAAVRDACLVTTTSAPLRDYVRDEYDARGDVVSMPSTVDKTIFHPRDRTACRRELGLPGDARLIGTAGGLYRDKGIAALYEAWSTLRARDPDLHLVLAGPHEAALPPPAGERMHYLGALSHERVAMLFSALDVGVMCIVDSEFGRYCFPQKAYEMLSCGLPVVAAAVGAMRDLFGGMPQSLYQAENAADLAEKITLQLAHPERCDVPIEDWSTLVAAIDDRLRQVKGTADLR
jgi:glycosyltransferase involved in cell wall biosynthesis